MLPELTTHSLLPLSQLLASFAAACLHKDPRQRPSAAQLLQHKLIAQARTSAHLQKHLLQGLPLLPARLLELQVRQHTQQAMLMRSAASQGRPSGPDQQAAAQPTGMPLGSRRTRRRSSLRSFSCSLPHAMAGAAQASSVPVPVPSCSSVQVSYHTHSLGWPQHAAVLMTHVSSSILHTRTRS